MYTYKNLFLKLPTQNPLKHDGVALLSINNFNIRVKFYTNVLINLFFICVKFETRHVTFNRLMFLTLINNTVQN